MNRACLLVGLASYLTIAPTQLLGQDASANGTLVELRSWEVPDSLSAVRIVFAASQILVISNNPDVVVVLDSMLAVKRTVRIPEEMRIGTAAVLPNGTLDLIAFDPTRRLNVDGEHSVLEKPIFGVAGEMLDALYVSPYGWVGAWQDTSGAVRISGEDNRQLALIPDSLFGEGAPRALRLSSGRGSILVTAVYPPHRAIRISLETGTGTFLSLPLEQAPMQSGAGMVIKKEVSMPLLQIRVSEVMAPSAILATVKPWGKAAIGSSAVKSSPSAP